MEQPGGGAFDLLLVLGLLSFRGIELCRAQAHCRGADVTVLEWRPVAGCAPAPVAALCGFQIINHRIGERVGRILFCGHAEQGVADRIGAAAYIDHLQVTLPAGIQEGRRSLQLLARDALVDSESSRASNRNRHRRQRLVMARGTGAVLYENGSAFL